MTTPPFVGEERHRLLRLIADRHAQVVEGRTPHWIAIEAPSGWGKTRLVQEFFGLIASTQPAPAYWPPRLLDGNSTRGVLIDRKLVRPHVTHVPGSLPAFMWWGITCQPDRGHPATALANDIRDLVAHLPYLEDALTQLRGRRSRLLSSTKRDGRQLLDVGAEEATTLLLEAAVSAALPGLGLLRPVIGMARGRAAARRERRDRLDGDDVIATPGAELVHASADMIRRISGNGGLPTVIAVEDVHHADATLRALLAELAELDDAPVIILTTSWSGHDASIDGEGVASDRVTRVCADHRADHTIDPLEGDDLLRIIEHRFPGTTPEVAAAIIGTSTTPLGVLLTLDTPRLRRFDGGALEISVDDARALPSAVEDVIRSMWNELPESARRGMALTAAATPAALGEVERTAIPPHRSLEWNRELLERTVASIGHDSAPAVELTGAAERFAWARPTGAATARFHEPVQHQVALSGLSDFMFDDERRRYLDHLAARTVDQWGRDALTGGDRSHLAELVVHLHLRGHGAVREVAGEAAEHIIRLLDDMPSCWPDLVAFADSVLTAGASGPSAEVLRVHRWRIAAELGDAKAARTATKTSTRIVDTAGNEFLGATARHHLAVIHSACGDLASAVDAAADAHRIRRRLLGSDHELTLRSALNHAHLLARSGEHELADREYREVADSARPVLGPGHVVVVGSGIGRAVIAAADRRTSESIRIISDTVAAAGLSADDPLRCILELNQIILSDRGHSERAEALHRTLDRTRSLLGSSHPMVAMIEQAIAYEGPLEPFLPMASLS